VFVYFWTQAEQSLPRRSVDTGRRSSSLYSDAHFNLSPLQTDSILSGDFTGWSERLHSLTSRQRRYTRCRWIASELLFHTPCRIARMLKPFLPGHKKLSREFCVIWSAYLSRDGRSHIPKHRRAINRSTLILITSKITQAF